MDEHTKQREEFAYIDYVLDKYTVFPRHYGFFETYMPLVNRLTPDQIKEIEKVYLQIAEKGDMWALSKWINEHGGSNTHEFQLFSLFSALARKGIHPFSTREVEFTLPPERLDWSKLPPELAYLRKPAMKYGVYQFHEDRDRLREEMTQEIMAELIALARRIRAPGELERISQWQVAAGDVREQTLVGWMVDVVQEMVPESWEDRGHSKRESPDG